MALVSPVEIGLTVTGDFLNYTLSEVQKIILLLGGSSASEDFQIDNNGIFLYGTLQYSRRVSSSVTYYLASDFSIAPDMMTSDSCIKNTRFGDGKPTYDIDFSLPSLVPRLDYANFKYNFSNSSLFTETNSPNFLFTNVIGYQFTNNFVLYFNEDSNSYPRADSSSSAVLGTLITSKPSFGNIARLSGGSASVYIPTGDTYTFNDIRNSINDVAPAVVPGYVAPTWNELLNGDYYIPDFFPSDLPSLEISSEIPFEPSFPEDIGETTTNLLEASLSFLSGTGFLPFFLTLCLIRMLILKFRRD